MKSSWEIITYVSLPPVLSLLVAVNSLGLVFFKHTLEVVKIPSRSKEILVTGFLFADSVSGLKKSVFQLTGVLREMNNSHSDILELIVQRTKADVEHEPCLR